MKKILVSAILSVLTIGLLAEQKVAQAQGKVMQDGLNDGLNAVDPGTNPSLLSSMSSLINIFLFLIGALAVLMIIYGGFRYVTSAGESSAVSSAKNTILYAAVGLVIAIAAYAIVNFVQGII